jgi:hypothetical protein
VGYPTALAGRRIRRPRSTTGEPHGKIPYEVAQFYRIWIESVKVIRLNLYLLNFAAGCPQDARSDRETLETDGDRIDGLGVKM